jgi:hypothetical protein
METQTRHLFSNMKIIFVFLFLLTSVFCFSNENRFGIQIEEITEIFSEEVYKRYQLELQAFGVQPRFQTRGITLYYTGDKKVNLTESRVIMVNLMHEFLKRINARQELRPFLIEYPLTLKYLDLSISLRHEGQKTKNSFMGYVYNEEGTICYNTFQMNTDELTTIHSETYEEAFEIVKKAGQLKPF